jgi:hypothetical protein
MAAVEKLPIRDCSELSAGDNIEAWHKGRLFHRGRVTRILPSTGLFWIEDSRSGSNKLLDVEALDVVRADSPVVQEISHAAPHLVWFSSA